MHVLYQCSAGYRGTLLELINYSSTMTEHGFVMHCYYLMLEMRLVRATTYSVQ